MKKNKNLLRILIILACFLLITGCKIEYKHVEYLGKVQSSRFIPETFSQRSGYAINVNGSEYFTINNFKKDEDVYLVKRNCDSFIYYIYNYDPRKIKSNK